MSLTTTPTKPTAERTPQQARREDPNISSTVVNAQPMKPATGTGSVEAAKGSTTHRGAMAGGAKTVPLARESSQGTSVTRSDDTRPRNALLSSLSLVVWTRLAPHVRHCLLFPGQTLQEAHEPTERIYFPNSGLISLTMKAQDGAQIEIAMIGPEGFTGAMAVIGLDRPFFTTTVQIAGNACWLPVHVLRDEFGSCEILQKRILRQCQMLTMQTSQGALCNRLHSVEERLNRWLLSVYDRIGTNEIETTHGDIARMLGTRRSSITLALGALQEAGLIDMTRGHITIIDREKMEQGACECYGCLRQQFDALAKVRCH